MYVFCGGTQKEGRFTVRRGWRVGYFATSTEIENRNIISTIQFAARMIG